MVTCYNYTLPLSAVLGVKLGFLTCRQALLRSLTETHPELYADQGWAIAWGLKASQDLRAALPETRAGSRHRFAPVACLW